MNFSDHPNRATIQVLRSEGGETHTIPCGFRGVEGKRLTVVSREYLPPRQTLSVEYSDAMFLGEVVACTPEQHGSWRTEIKVEHILTGLESLMNLRSRLMEHSAPQRTEVFASSFCH